MVVVVEPPEEVCPPLDVVPAPDPPVPVLVVEPPVVWPPPAEWPPLDALEEPLSNAEASKRQPATKQAITAEIEGAAKEDSEGMAGGYASRRPSESGDPEFGVGVLGISAGREGRGDVCQSQFPLLSQVPVPPPIFTHVLPCGALDGKHAGTPFASPLQTGTMQLFGLPSGQTLELYEMEDWPCVHVR